MIKVLGDPTAPLNAIKGGQVNGLNSSTNDPERDRGRRLDHLRQRARLTGLLLLDRAGT